VYVKLNALSETVEDQESNQAQLLVCGAQFFPAALQAIAGAQREVRIETYIFAHDSVGKSFFDAMCEAVARGVNVRLVLDGFGGQEGIQVWVPQLREAGVHVRIFQPEGLMFRLNLRRMRRMHRKMIAVDNQIAFVGGINLIDDLNHAAECNQFGNETLGPRYDFAVQLQGPIVQVVWHNMEWLWLQIKPSGMVTDTIRLSRWKDHVDHLKAVFLARQYAKQTLRPTSRMSIELAVRDNFRLRRQIERAYLKAIGQAKSTVILSNAYFLPGRKMRKAILAASARGVQVQLLLQGRVEYRFQHYATQNLYSVLLKAGVRIYEYTPGFLHAKVAVVDHIWATVGSSNLDPLSFLLAREANVVIRHHQFAEQLKNELLRAIEQDSKKIQADQHEQRSIKSRFLSWICYKLIRIAVFIGGFGSRY
jgi:cardiolipin synthase